MGRVNITRAQFEEKFGIKPDEDSASVAFYSPGCALPSLEFVFVDESIPLKDQQAISELERIFNLDAQA